VTGKVVIVFRHAVTGADTIYQDNDEDHQHFYMLKDFFHTPIRQENNAGTDRFRQGEITIPPMITAAPFRKRPPRATSPARTVRITSRASGMSALGASSSSSRNRMTWPGLGFPLPYQEFSP
jgi:hypothetical protein